MALIGVGHLVGMAVGIAMLVGLIISWFVLVPWQTSLAGLGSAPDIETLVGTAFRQKVRFIGAGTMGVAADLDPAARSSARSHAASPPRSLRAARAAPAGRTASPLTERDIPIGIIGGGILICAGADRPAACRPSRRADRSRRSPALTLALSLFYIFVAGAIIAAITGYMAGLIGASNSPVSGVGILTVLGISLDACGSCSASRPTRARRRASSPSPCS